MQDNYYDNYGVTSGYNQIAPGRDVAKPRVPGQPGRPRTNPIQDAIMPPPVPPVGQAVPRETPTFRGAQQTIGAPPTTAQDGGIADVSTAVTGNPQPYEQGGITGRTTPPVTQPAQAPAAPAPTYDSSQWNTKGYATPKYIADAVSGTAPAGWDQTKWSDPNYQDPKYVIGRIQMQDSGGDGRFQTPEERAKVVADIQRAYPGATFDGKDMIDLHDGGAPIDIFRAAGSGEYGMQFAPQDGGGSARPASSSPSPIQNAILGTPGMSQQTSTYASGLIQQLMQALQLNPQLAGLAQQYGS